LNVTNNKSRKKAFSFCRLLASNVYMKAALMSGNEKPRYGSDNDFNNCYDALKCARNNDNSSLATSEDPASKGLEEADDNVHENAPDQDIEFHEGTCQGGHTTEALEDLGGCDILSDPGNSDDNRNDD
jgi:hypothetical protein